MSAAQSLTTGDRQVAGSLSGVRAQVDSIGYATRAADMAAVITACRRREAAAVEARRHELSLPPDLPWTAAVMPHDDYLYAGPVYLHLLPGLKAPRWLLFGVCHACRRLGVRDRLIFDDFTAWEIAGDRVPVATDLRDDLLARLSTAEAYIDDDRHAAEHSVEALLPWLRSAVPQATFVAILVPGMSWEKMQELSGRLAEILATLCRERGWLPGRDLGILISADAVHYGCEDWGPRGGYHPFGCGEGGHGAARIQDLTLADATLVGKVTADGLARFARMVWDPDHPEYPYRITWCGLYSIPCGLLTAARWQAELDLAPLNGFLLRYGDSVSDERLQVDGTGLGVTAPNSLVHWVGYVALGYAPVR